LIQVTLHDLEPKIHHARSFVFEAKITIKIKGMTITETY
jgi:hypothetical protein